MFVPSLLAAVVPAALACPAPDPRVPPRPSHDLLAGAPLTPDGRAHVLTADSGSVCWWSVDEDGGREIHRVWPLPGPHGVGLAAGEDGSVLVAISAPAGWGILVVGPEGDERGWPTWSAGRLVDLRLRDGHAELDWDLEGVRLRSRVELERGSVREVLTLGRSDAAQSRR